MTRLFLAIGLALALAALTSPEPATSKRPPHCPVTIPGGVPATGSGSDASFNYGNAKLRVQLWPRGILPAGPLPDGSVWATIDRAGTIHAKLGWWRGIPGKLVVTGRRVDAHAPRLSAHVPNGYGRLGFQPTGLEFPTPGCWRVVGSIGATRLTFVVKVRKVGRG